MTLGKDEALDLVATWIGCRLQLVGITEKRPFVGPDRNRHLTDEEKVLRETMRETEEEMWELGLVKRRVK